MKIPVKSVLLLLLLVIVSLFPLRYLFEPGFFPMHDDTQVARVAQMGQALQQGQFPVRWVGDLGYGFGYPIFNFYNPLPYYFGGIFVLFGLNALLATKIMIITGFIISGLGMFLLGKTLWGDIGGIISSVSYIFIPYHAVQLYVRGAVAELWGYGLLPFIALGIIKKNITLTALSLVLLILSHNLTVVMAMPFIVILFIVMIVSEKKEKRFPLILKYASALFISLTLSAFYWLPAIAEKQFTLVDLMVEEQFNPLEHFVYPAQLWQSLWGFGGSAPGMADGMSFQAGKLQIALVLLIICITPYIAAKHRKLFFPLIFLLLLLVSGIFMLLPVSGPVWIFNMPLLKYLQFPWRYLTFTAFFSSLMIGVLPAVTNILFPKKFTLIAGAVITVLLIYGEGKFFYPRYIYAASAGDFLTDEKIRWQASSASDEYLPLGFIKPTKEEIIPVKDKFSVEGGTVNPVFVSFAYYNLSVWSPAGSLLNTRIADFPGWRAKIDGKVSEINRNNGLVSVRFPQGNHKLELEFTDTPVRKAANYISLTGLVLLSVVLYQKYVRS